MKNSQNDVLVQIHQKFTIKEEQEIRCILSSPLFSDLTLSQLFTCNLIVQIKGQWNKSYL